MPDLVGSEPLCPVSLRVPGCSVSFPPTGLAGGAPSSGMSREGSGENSAVHTAGSGPRLPEQSSAGRARCWGQEDACALWKSPPPSPVPSAQASPGGGVVSLGQEQRLGCSCRRSSLGLSRYPEASHGARQGLTCSSCSYLKQSTGLLWSVLPARVLC